MTDLIVIGGGLIGLSVAYHAVKGGAKVLLIDRADAGRATDAGAGIIAPQTSGFDKDPAWFKFGVKAAAYYPSLVAQLEADDAGETGYRVVGLLKIAIDDDELAAHESYQRAVFERQKRTGVPAEGSLYPVSPVEARELFPALSENIQAALFFRDAVRIDGRLFAAALRRAAEKQGLIVQQASADRLLIANGKVRGVEAAGEVFSAAKVVIAGGAWSPEFGGQLGLQIAVEPQRGQIIHLGLPGTETVRWPMVNAYRGHYLVAWDDSRIAAGASRETGSGYAPHTTAEGVREVLTEALRVAPGLKDAHIHELRVGLRPYTHDKLPVVSSVPGVENVTLCTGHGATGLQLGPYSGKLAADWALGNPLEADIAAFDVRRFSDG